MQCCPHMLLGMSCCVVHEYQVSRRVTATELDQPRIGSQTDSAHSCAMACLSSVVSPCGPLDIHQLLRLMICLAVRLSLSLYFNLLFDLHLTFLCV